MAFNLLPREDEYFIFFSQIAEKIQEAANILVEMLQDKRENYEAYTKRIKDAEHACDELTHQQNRPGVDNYNSGGGNTCGFVF